MDTDWFKTSYSGGGNDQCVEVRIGGAVGVRDTKARDAGELWVAPSAWSAFLAACAQTAKGS
jgi:hypothetical protein